jgi:hypothetical protein
VPPSPKPGQADPEADESLRQAGPEAEGADGKASSRRASRGSSRASSAAASPFFDDPGPGFDPDEAEADAEPFQAAPEPVDLVLWTPERVRRVLVLQGQLTHMAVGVAETDWVWQDDELDAVCGPLAEHANRVPALQALAHLSDDAAIAAGFVKYALRSWLERTRAIQAQRAAREAGPQSVTGRTVGDDEQPIDAEEVPWTTPPA